MKSILLIIVVFVATLFYANSRKPADATIIDIAKQGSSIRQKNDVPSYKPLPSVEDTIKNGQNFERNVYHFQGTKTLKQAYQNYFPIGAAVTPDVDLNNPSVALFLKTQFSSLTPKQAMQPVRIHPKEFTYNWTIPDMLVDFAQKNKMLVRGHCLIYSSRAGHMPDWFYSDNGQPASKELILKRMKDHITTIVNRYKGKVYCWDVVNEAISPKRDEHFNSNDQLYQLLGEDYIAKAFEYAHTADPNAKLFYNDNFDDYSPNRRTYIFDLLKGLKNKGVPIDGIGMQCHLGINGITKQYLQETIDMFHSIGLDFQITELDVSIYKRYIKQDELLASKEDYTPDIQEAQATAFKNIFEVCRQNKGKVTGVTFWGSYDNDDERNSLTKKLGKKNYPFLFDKDMKPKNAFNKVTDF